MASPPSTSIITSVRVDALIGVLRPPGAWRSAQDVGPDTLGPSFGVVPVERRLPGRELLLDLHHLAVLDLVGVDDGDDFPVTHPRVAGVQRWHLRHRPVAEQ